MFIKIDILINLKEKIKLKKYITIIYAKIK